MASHASLPLGFSAFETTFGELVVLASLREPTTGIYRAVGITDTAEETDGILRLTHAQVFGQWIAYSLQEQTEDLNRYLSSIQMKPADVARLWRRSQIYQRLVPSSASESDRELFLQDMAILLDVVEASCDREQ